MRVFNKKWTRRLEAGANDFMILRPYAFADVPERYTKDITFKMGVKAGDIEIIETRKQQEVLENEPVKAVEENPEEDMPVTTAAEVVEKPAKKGRGKKSAEAE